MNRLAWTVYNGAQRIFTLLWTAGWISLALLVRLVAGGRHWPLRLASRCWAPGLLHGAGARLAVEGLERVDGSQPHVFVANHPSMIDVCALFRALPVPVRFVLKQELARVPFVGWYARATRMVFLERASARGSARRLRAAVDTLRGGASVCAFPEGPHSRDGCVGAFKGGAFHLAIEAGAWCRWRSKAAAGLLPATGFRVRPGRITVRIGEPLATRALAPGDRNALAQQARAAVAALLDRPGSDAQ